jgi:large subunit ribosomal protein L6
MATATATPEVRLSRVGKRAVNIPKGVTVNLSDVKCDVQGPKGKLSVPIPGQVIAKKDGDAISFTSSAPGRDAARLQGLSRALLASAVKGAAEGYEKVLELVGTGYRAEIKGKFITLALGFSHPTNVEVPAGITAVVPPDSKGTQLVLTSADKAKLGQLAASIRDLRPPEPYGGKGIRYRGENIRRKAGKAAKGKGK